MQRLSIETGPAVFRRGAAAALLIVVWGCGGDPAQRGAGDSPSGPSRQAQGQESQGQESQGQESQGQESQGQESQGQDTEGNIVGPGGGTYWIHPYQARPGATAANAWLVRPSGTVKVGELAIERGDLHIVQGATPSLAACASPFSEPADVLTRACQWGRAGIGSCQPNTTVTVTLPTCAEGVAAAHGAMVRVCQDLDACEAALSIGADAALCNPNQPTATATFAFSCPPSGYYNLMKAVFGTSSPPEALPALSASPGPLKAVLSGHDLVGLHLRGEQNGVDKPAGALFRILQVSNRPGVPATSYYVVQKLKTGAVSETDEASWEHLCRPASVTDPDVSAIALTGKWTRSGDWQDDPSVFSFACRRGVLAKCYEWGYVPWQPGRRVYHQTCTRIARADYCGSGNAHTVDGTLIDLEDVPTSTSGTTSRSINTICTTQKTGGPPGATCSLDPALFLLESVWAADLRASSVNACGETKVPPKLICLSKKRWESIPLGGYCSDTMIDPRVNDCRSDPRYAKYYCNRAQTFSGASAAGSHCNCKHGQCDHGTHCNCKHCGHDGGDDDDDDDDDDDGGGSGGSGGGGSGGGGSGGGGSDGGTSGGGTSGGGSGGGGSGDGGSGDGGLGDPCTDSSVILRLLADTDHDCGVYCDDIIPQAGGVSSISGSDKDQLSSLRSQLGILNGNPALYNDRLGLFIVFSTPVDTTLSEIVDTSGERFIQSGNCTVGGTACALPSSNFTSRTVLGSAYRSNILNSSNMIPLYAYVGSGAALGDRMMTAWYEPPLGNDPYWSAYWGPYQKATLYARSLATPAGWIFSPTVPSDRLPKSVVPLYQCRRDEGGIVDHVLATPASASLDPNPALDSRDCPRGYRKVGLEGYLPYGPSPSQLQNAEICNGVDDNGDGRVDRNANGDPLTLACDYRGCCKGTRTCASGRYGACVGAQEQCNGLDEDCDGFVDNARENEAAPLTKTCSTRCESGTEVCVGGRWGACSARQPVTETCNGVDDDCDGVVDNMAGTASPLTEACSSVCESGVKTCSGGSYGACSARLPTPEVCNGIDDDCDSGVDNVTGTSGPLTIACANECGSGEQICVNGSYGACSARLPTPEVCNGVDDDCDGGIDNVTGTSGALTIACTSACGSGEQICVNGNYGACSARLPTPEVCNGVDDDCDGGIDNVTGTSGPLTIACTSECGSGEQICVNGNYGACSAPACVCGNGTCDSGETCSNCPGDCGACPPVCSNQVPAMTSPTLPSGSVTRSGAYSLPYDAWMAFDNSDTSMWISETDPTQVWIGYEWYDGPKLITRYAIGFVNGTLRTRAPKDWTLQAWDGSSWVVVDTRTNEINWGSKERREYIVVTPGAYSRYRLLITDDNDPSAGIVAVSMGRLELMSCSGTP